MTNRILLSIPGSPWISSVYVLGLISKVIGCGTLSKPDHLVQLWVGCQRYLARASKCVGLPSSLRARGGPRGPMQSNWLYPGLPLKEETGGWGEANTTSMDQVLSEGPESLYLLLTQGQIHSPKLFYKRIFLYTEDTRSFGWRLSWYCGSSFLSAFCEGNKTQRNVFGGCCERGRQGRKHQTQLFTSQKRCLFLHE